MNPYYQTERAVVEDIRRRSPRIEIGTVVGDEVEPYAPARIQVGARDASMEGLQAAGDMEHQQLVPGQSVVIIAGPRPMYIGDSPWATGGA